MTFAEAFLNGPVMARYLPAIAQGFLVTVELAGLVVLTGLSTGLALALVRSFGIRPLNWLIVLLVDLFRALPPLVLIVLIYFGLPDAGVVPSGFVATWASLSLVLMAFAEEIFWAGLQAVPRGQWEAAQHRAGFCGDAGVGRAAAGAAHHHPPAHQPDDCDYQGHVAGVCRRGLGDIVTGIVSGVVQLQPLPAHAWGGGVPRAIPAGGGPGPLDRDAVPVIETFLNAKIAVAAWPILLTGLLSTTLLALMVVPLGIVGGLGLALLSTVRHAAVRIPVMAWVDLFRAFPPLVLLILLYAGLPFAGVDLGSCGAVAVGFFLNTGAYYGEVLRAGIESVPPGQTEAARSTGLTRLQALVWVVLPQAVRNVLPDLVSNTLEVVKLTSLASVVAVPELLSQARQAQSLTYNPTPIIVAALLYFLLLWPIVRLLSRLENRTITRS